MAAPISYAHRVAAAIEMLEQRSSRWLGRQDLEELLGVSKTVAWRLLRTWGAKPVPGGALCLERLELLERLRGWSEGAPVAQAAARHERIAEHLAGMRQYVQSRRRQIAEGEKAGILFSSRLANLPANIQLKPTSLHVEFSGMEEFMAAVAALVFALQNDFDEVRQHLGE